jgi:hypothetical protein
MEPLEQEKLRQATMTLEGINELVRRGDQAGVAATVRSFPHFRELARVVDREGQSIFFKLAFLEDEGLALRLMEELQR